jgi:hypothetical protein
VQVNKVTKTLVAQGGAVDIGPLSARLDNPFQLQPGQTASLEAQELSVEFVEVVEDSRCPQGVLCTWEGQALIRVRVSVGGAQQALTLKLGPADSVTGAYEGYLFELMALDPYPQAPEQDAPPPDYTATLLVSQAQGAPEELIQFYLIKVGDEGQSGPAAGCGDSAIAVWVNRAKTGSLPDDLRASLEELLSIETQAYGHSGLLHALHFADLAVQNVTLSGGTALVELSGSLSPMDSCSNAQMEAQILHTVFQYTQVNTVLVYVDGKNMRQIFDAGVGADEPYARWD